MKYLLIFFMVGYIGYTQTPQTNIPKVFYPIVDEYIKGGYDRNYRTHTRILDNIKYVYFIDLNELNETEAYEYPMGSSLTFKVYETYLSHKKKDEFFIFINVELYDDYYLLRRIIFKTIGIMHGLPECHTDCTHIMSKQTVLNPDFLYYDMDETQWREELDLLYKQLYKKKPLN